MYHYVIIAASKSKDGNLDRLHCYCGCFRAFQKQKQYTINLFKPVVRRGQTCIDLTFEAMPHINLTFSNDCITCGKYYVSSLHYDF